MLMVQAYPAVGGKDGRIGSRMYDHTKLQNKQRLTLKAAIRKAITVAPNLRSVQYAFNASMGKVEQANYYANPEFHFELENIIGSGQFNGLTMAEYTYSIVQKIELGGKRIARMQRAKAESKAQYVNISAERLSIRQNVIISYIQVLVAEKKLNVADNQKKLAHDLMNTISKRVAAAAELDHQLSNAETTYAKSVMKRQQLAREYNAAKEKLRILLGEVSLKYKLDDRILFSLKAPMSLAEYKKSLLFTAEMRRLHFIEVEKQATLKLEKALSVPDPNFSLGIRYFKNSSDKAYVFGASIPLPVYDQNKGEISRAKARVVQAESDKQYFAHQWEENLTNNWQLWKASFFDAKHFKTKLLPAAEKAFKLARGGYEKGRLSYLEVLEAQRFLFESQMQYYDTLYRCHLARANVERLTTKLRKK